MRDSHPSSGGDEHLETAAWLLTKVERANRATTLDERHPGDDAWSIGNRVLPLIHGSAYFAELLERIEATQAGDLVLFTDWQGDADQQLADRPDSRVADVLGAADERGVDVRGLVWRSHSAVAGFSSRENANLGRRLQDRGVEAILDMRVRMGGSHHQKMVVIRHAEHPERDVAFVGGIDLAHSRRDTRTHAGDPQPLTTMPSEYGRRPPWHDIQAAITGPAVHDVETVFRERWDDPTTLRRSPVILVRDRLRGLDTSPDPLPPQLPPPPAVDDSAGHTVQLLRTYPDLRGGRDYDFAPGGERSVASGYSKAIERARRLIYIEDQYLWGNQVGDVFTQALRDNPELHVIAVVPLHPDVTGVNRVAQLEGRRRAMHEMEAAAPGRVAAYGIENEQGTPIYVHAKTCIIDDLWTTIGSDNFNRRSWTHDSELSAVVFDPSRDYGRALRLRLAAEHLGRSEDDDLTDCLDPHDMFETFASTARTLDSWHDATPQQARPHGRLRRLDPPPLHPLTRALASVPYRLFHDPDGRPWRLRVRHRL